MVLKKYKMGSLNVFMKFDGKIQFSKNSLLLYRFILIFVTIFIALNIKAANIQGGDNDFFNQTYNKARDFKAVAKAYQNSVPLMQQGQPVLSFAVKYDTAQSAANASVGYCKKLVNKDSQNLDIRVILLGNISVNNQGKLDKYIEIYQVQIEKFLETEFNRSKERDFITRLSTTLQKTGEYKKSEGLLLDRAMGGEILAQNALAYHWAELKINLPIALSFADNAVRSDPDFFSFHDTRALVLFRLGREKEALIASAKSVSLKSHPIAFDHYGDILWETGIRIEAVKQWENAIINAKDILFIHRVSLKIKTGKIQDIIFE